ncbi:MAG: alginate lyase family protein [Bacteroidota bacterium]
MEKTIWYILLPLILLVQTSCREKTVQSSFPLEKIERERILKLADTYGKYPPRTITDSICARSAGGIHDFYSEGDYWWPDPDNPGGPYIRKDGLTNPDNFTVHREAMIRLGQISGALASAYKITGHTEYVAQLAPHLRAWFLDETTRMNPNLLYGQAISGRVTGRGIGIIDTIHLLEVAKAVMAIEDSDGISKTDIQGIKTWFSQYLKWITTHPYGIAERDNGNNHSVCWALQVAVFSELTGNTEQLNYVQNMYKTVLLEDQMDERGAFPLELERTKPYGYSLFTLDAMTAICQVASEHGENLFVYSTSNGKNISKGLSFLYPYVKDKKGWPYSKDVRYWDDWPVRHSSFLFGGLVFGDKAYLTLWESLDPEFDQPEIIRNMPIRFPLLWVK